MKLDCGLHEILIFLPASLRAKCSPNSTIYSLCSESRRSPFCNGDLLDLIDWPMPSALVLLHTSEAGSLASHSLLDEEVLGG